MSDKKKPSLWDRTKEVATTYTGTFIVVMVLNQLLFFGFCLNPICLIAAMPHVLLITVLIGSLINKMGSWGEKRLAEKTGKAVGIKLEKIGNTIEATIEEIEKAAEEVAENARNEEQKRLTSDLISNRESIKTPGLLERSNAEPITDSQDFKWLESNAALSEERKKRDIIYQKKYISGHHKVYITKSNLLKIVRTLDPESIPIGSYDRLYKHSLRQILSHKELALLCVYKEACESPELAYESYKKVAALTNSKRFVYEGSFPSYHRDRCCKLLHGNYFNIEIPAEIKAKGDSEIERFIEFCKSNSSLIEQGDPLVLTKLEAQFFLKNPPSTISAKNSGVEEFSNMDLNELEEQIDNLLIDAERYRNRDSDTYNLIKRLGYGTHSVPEGKMPENPLYIWHNTYKIPLKEMLQHYFRVRFNEELAFNGKLLDQLGFKPCDRCS